MLTITEAEAREKKLPGFDTFRGTHLAYKDDLNRDAFVVSLYYEAYKIFLSSARIKLFPSLKQYSQKVEEDFNNGLIIDSSNYPGSQILSHVMEYVNLENFYIATGFELFCKSKLLEKDLLVNVLEDSSQFKDLRSIQKKRPIHKSELFKISGYYYDNHLRINVLKGITDKSLDFSLIVREKNYFESLDLSKDILDIITEFRVLRNQIHLPGDYSDSPNLQRIGKNLVPIIAEFIDKMIVERTNYLVDKWHLHFRYKINKLNY